MNLNSQTKAILFADISGSSALYKTSGNENAKHIVDFLLSALSKLVIENQGIIIKSIGDEIMTCFDDCQICLQVAIKMQQQFSELLPQQNLSLSIGIGFGEVISDKNDLFGEAVNDAAYLTHVAKGRQVLLSESVFANLDEDLRVNVSVFDRVVMKGANKESWIYRYFWQDEKVSVNVSDFETRLLSVDKVLSGILPEQITLTYQDQQFTIKCEDTPFYIGRDETKCQLTILADQVSRDHCQINFSRGKFVLVDHSTNGCYVKTVNKDEMYIRREEYPLVNDTLLSLGARVENNADEIVQLSLTRKN